MRLLSTSEWQFKEFQDPQHVQYAILSHRWGKDEVTFDTVLDPAHQKGYGFAKIVKAREIARQNHADWVWIDTCCIDKKSSSELSEAINSMFLWYRYSHCCYAFMPDVKGSPGDKDTFVESFKESQWFKRGWTLQELLAPRYVRFFNDEFKQIGDKETLATEITEVTGIQKDFLVHRKAVGAACVSERMSWAAGRETTKPEDAAYCLLGIFGVNMPLLYGEGSKAFIRLQLEIIKQSDDESIFAWQSDGSEQDQIHGMLARKADAFVLGGYVRPTEMKDRQPHVFTSRGLEMQVPGQWLNNEVICTPVSRDERTLTVTLACVDLRLQSNGMIPQVVLRRSKRHGMWQRVRYECRRPSTKWWLPPPPLIRIYVPQPEIDQARPLTNWHDQVAAISQRQSMMQLIVRCIAIFGGLLISRLIRDRALTSSNMTLEAAIDLCTWCFWMFVWRNTGGGDTALLEMLANGLLMVCACWRSIL